MHAVHYFPILLTHSPSVNLLQLDLKLNSKADSQFTSKSRSAGNLNLFAQHCKVSMLSALESTNMPLFSQMFSIFPASDQLKQRSISQFLQQPGHAL